MDIHEFDSPSFSGPNALKLPSQYKFIKVLGEGGFGKVVKCWRKDLRQTVAVKVPLYPDEEDREIPMMKKLMHLKLDQHNIIKFFDWFDTIYGRALVFEMLDISLEDYIEKTNYAPMRLSDIQTIIQQLATALKALRRVGVIHNDIKPDNIMMVDHRRRPFKVKLIDFGLAFLSSKAKHGMVVPTINTSPEIILGLPFSEGIDMWSLGYMMAILITGDELIPAGAEYDTMNYIVEVLGQPPDHLLNNGQKTKRYFTKTESDSWRLKTHQEYWKECSHKPCSPSIYTCLDDLKHLRLEWKNKFEAVERGHCIDLLEAMLQLDQSDRITPSEVLTHPFIDKSRHSSNIKMNKNKTAMKNTQRRANRGFSPSSIQPSSSPVRVRPRAAKGVRKMASLSEDPPSTASLRKDDTTCILPDQHRPAPPAVPPPGMILVRPAAAKNMLQTEADESADSFADELSIVAALAASEEPPATAAPKADDTISIHLDQHKPLSPTIPTSGVILVRPAAAENILQTDYRESAEKLQAERKSSEKVSEDITDSETAAWICQDSNTLFSDNTAHHQRKKKKKNKVQRFFSWMRKTFSSCFTAMDKDDNWHS